jgi:hypothetical protein
MCCLLLKAKMKIIARSNRKHISNVFAPLQLDTILLPYVAIYEKEYAKSAAAATYETSP